MQNVSTLAEELIVAGSAADRACISLTLAHFGNSALFVATRAGIRVKPLPVQTHYSAASPALARLEIDVDAWPVPPAGLFVVEERTIYLRSRSAMTVAHEFGHALDCALGNGTYLSGVDPRIRQHFTNATRFVTPYAATAVDEYFAEALRAYVEVNDPASHWPRATRERLRQIDPPMHEYVDRLFQTGFSLDIASESPGRAAAQTQSLYPA